MKNDDKYIVELARAAVFDDEPKRPDQDINWEYIYAKCCEQNISGLIYCSVQKLDADNLPSKELMDKWNKSMLATVVASSKRYSEFSRMTKILHDQNIKIVGLKGCILRNIYPVPELRTMGDFDMLTSKENIPQIASIFSENGYTITKDSYGIICKNEKAYWEIFFELDEEFAVNTQKWTEKVYDNSIITDNGIYCPEKTFFLAHVIVHTSRHYIQNGAGLRNLCDIALFMQKYRDEINFEQLKRICSEQNYEKTYTYIINAVDEYFGVDVSGINVEKKNSEKFLEYMMLNGVFGKHGNTLFWQVTKDEDENKSAVMKLFFPNVKNLKNRYKYLQKYPFLLPAAWIQRLFAALFKWKYSFRQMAGDMDEAFAFSEERIKWLNELGLSETH